MSDTAGDSNLHFFELILNECFLNQSCQISNPPDAHHNEFPEEEKGKLNPNDLAIFEHPRKADWLKSTWDEHISPKYKKALDKWNKDTGGGDGTPASILC